MDTLLNKLEYRQILDKLSKLPLEAKNRPPPELQI